MADGFKNPEDEGFMLRALALAERGLYTTSPNPRVGCVVVRGGEIVGEGWHERAGGPHAEIVALSAAGAAAKNSCVYVTLEPCCHQGRTPPCVENLIHAEVSRVVIAAIDPDSRVSGQGIEKLRKAGITVLVGLLEEEARQLNIGFFSRLCRGIPWVRLKVGMSLDGQIALPDGNSFWITSLEARADGHTWRARACALLTGGGTVRADDPQLTVRGVETSRTPIRVVLDPCLRLSPESKVFQGGALVVCTDESLAWVRLTTDTEFSSSFDAVSRQEHRLHWDKRCKALEALGCELLVLPNLSCDRDTKNPRNKIPFLIDLKELLRVLGRRGVNELHVEAGSCLNGALIEACCVDEFLVYIAPSLLGRSIASWDISPPENLMKCRHLFWHSIDRIGQDLRLLLRYEKNQS